MTQITVARSGTGPVIDGQSAYLFTICPGPEFLERNSTRDRTLAQIFLASVNLNAVTHFEHGEAQHLEQGVLPLASNSQRQDSFGLEAGFRGYGMLAV